MKKNKFPKFVDINGRLYVKMPKNSKVVCNDVPNAIVQKKDPKNTLQVMVHSQDNTQYPTMEQILYEWEMKCSVPVITDLNAIPLSVQKEIQRVVNAAVDIDMAIGANPSLSTSIFDKDQLLSRISVLNVYNMVDYTIVMSNDILRRKNQLAGDMTMTDDTYCIMMLGYLFNWTMPIMDFSGVVSDREIKFRTIMWYNAVSSLMLRPYFRYKYQYQLAEDVSPTETKPVEEPIEQASEEEANKSVLLPATISKCLVETANKFVSAAKRKLAADVSLSPEKARALDCAIQRCDKLTEIIIAVAPDI